jgi:hypothetical protein
MAQSLLKSKRLFKRVWICSTITFYVCGIKLFKGMPTTALLHFIFASSYN